ncbi:hypothetical protein N431DRAFT_556511 [Stipitochalara longipes BDJ]|nr:hypothetical protein N431DRAFT_556511 [Stipitochalara longipes BDJ]
MDVTSLPEPPFYTLSSIQNDENNSDISDHSGFPSPYQRTHDTSGSSFHLDGLPEFVEALNQAAERAFPNKTSSQPRYKKVEVLLLRWEQDDLNVEPELSDLARVFRKYNFGTESWLIPAQNSHRKMMLKAGEFVEKHESKDCLMVVYYGGHAYINPARQSTWCCTRKKDGPSLDWSAVQTLFVSSTSDVLLLLDCCSAASSAPRGGIAVTETIAACGWESIAPEPGRFSFTSALIEVLDEWKGRTFSVAMLHSQILSVLKHERPELLGGTRRVECRRTPVYIMTTTNHQVPSITLSCLKLQVEKEIHPPATMEWEGAQLETARAPSKAVRKTKRRRKSKLADNESPFKRFKGIDAGEPIASGDNSMTLHATTTSSITQLPSPPEAYAIGSIQSVTSEGQYRVPHILISIALAKDQSLDAVAASEWLAAFPALTQYAKVESIYRSFSTLLMVSLPLFIWDLLPDDSAISFVGYIMSENFLRKPMVPQIQNKVVASPQESYANSPTTTREATSDYSSQLRDPDFASTYTPVIGRLSRPPSAARSVSVRSLSPASGNLLRYPGDKILSAGINVKAVNPRKKRTGTYASNLKTVSGAPSALEFSDNQNSMSAMGPPAKKSRTNTPWTPSEEQRLKTMREAGSTWAEIAKTFPSRTEGSVKKHWYKDMHYAEFAEDESVALLNAIKESETNKWKEIAKKVGKPAKACEQYAKEKFSYT